MTRTSLGILAGLALTALVAPRLDGGVRVGVLWGYTFGAALGALSITWQRAVLRSRPEGIGRAMVLSFLVKLGGVLVGALALRYVEPLARVAHWMSFVLAYTGAIGVCLVLGSMDLGAAAKGEPTR